MRDETVKGRQVCPVRSPGLSHPIFAAHPYAQFLALAPCIYHLANNSWTAGPDIGRGHFSGVAGNEIPHLFS